MVDLVFFVGVAAVAVLFWLFLKLAFGVGGSKGAFIVVIGLTGLLATQLKSIPFLFVPIMGALLQMGYPKGNIVESAAVTMLTLTLAVFLATQVGV